MRRTRIGRAQAEQFAAEPAKLYEHCYEHCYSTQHGALQGFDDYGSVRQLEWERNRQELVALWAAMLPAKLAVRNARHQRLSSEMSALGRMLSTDSKPRPPPPPLALLLPTFSC